MLDGSTWLTIGEAARRARVRVETIRQWVNRGRVSSVKLSGRVWVCWDEVADCELAWRKREEAS